MGYMYEAWFWDQLVSGNYQTVILCGYESGSNFGVCIHSLNIEATGNGLMYSKL